MKPVVRRRAHGSWVLLCSHGYVVETRTWEAALSEANACARRSVVRVEVVRR